MAAAKAPNIVWQPQAGSQELFLRCPIYECLYEGTRGPGKTDALLMDFAQNVGRGYGAQWRGVLFRREYKEFDDIIATSESYFPRIFPGVKFLQSRGDYRWVFPTGERLSFRAIKQKGEEKAYQGHSYPWVGWDELTNWPDEELYIALLAVCRSTHPDIPRHYRAACNPWGVGHHWVKSRHIDPAPRGIIIDDEQGRERVAIHGTIWENKILLENDPDYVKALEAQTGAKRKAWLYGDWDIVAGGMFGDVWDLDVHVIEPFDIPTTWRIDRSFDWGSSRPYAVGWWAESDGCDIVLADGTKQSTRRGDLFRIAELYGWTGKANEGTRELAVEVARKIKRTEKGMGHVVHAGPADSSIYDVQDGSCIADKMGTVGVGWLRANKGPGSRVNGWELLRERLKNSITRDGPGMFVFETCRQFIRTVPALPRDAKKPDDVDSEAEDHIGDETRYRVLAKTHKFVATQW